MADFKELIISLRQCISLDGGCYNCKQYKGDWKRFPKCWHVLFRDSADAIEELLRIGAKMHTWIFLHTTDEQAAYDEIGLTEEQNALFGYSGQMILKAEPPKGVE
jgi:hypothetical protein